MLLLVVVSAWCALSGACITGMRLCTSGCCGLGSGPLRFSLVFHGLFRPLIEHERGHAFIVNGFVCCSAGFCLYEGCTYDRALTDLEHTQMIAVHLRAHRNPTSVPEQVLDCYSRISYWRLGIVVAAGHRQRWRIGIAGGI